MSAIIEIDHIYKLYRKGLTGSVTFKQDFKRWWTSSVLRKKDPFFKSGIGTENSSHFWALQDISFNVNEGEILGIIGKNGSGKSTLLKIISRITSPTRGSVKGRGVISSMLEVGTGFSPDLTGRQNVFLSGHILGMTRQEINEKFDDIVDFSGVGAFIDTPVKRYSSGMYVRLAFSVAAHLQSDILIIDEVLAVGDAEFQQKCLQKMNEITRSGGRTILFVTHNMQPVKQFCNRVLWLDDGRNRAFGSPQEIVREYLTSLGYVEKQHTWESPETAPGNAFIKIRSVAISSPQGALKHSRKDSLEISCTFWSFLSNEEICLKMSLLTDEGFIVFESVSQNLTAARGVIEFIAVIPSNFLNDIAYSVSFGIYKKGQDVPITEFPYALSFSVESEAKILSPKFQGAIRPYIETSFKLITSNVLN